LATAGGGGGGGGVNAKATIQSMRKLDGAACDVRNVRVFTLDAAAAAL